MGGVFAKKPVEMMQMPQPPEKLISVGDILFFFDDFTIRPDQKPILREMIAMMKNQEKIIKIRVDGYTDSVGTVEYNLALSQKRAQAVAEVIGETMSLPPDHMQVIGHGETGFVASNGNYQGRQKNRRVEIRFLSAAP